MEYSDILDKLNYGKKIKIRLKPRKSVRVIVLEYNINNQRKYEHLKLHITGDSITDKQSLRVAASIRDEKELKLYNEQAGMELFQTKRVKIATSFYDYAISLIECKIDKTRAFYESGINSFVDRIGKDYAINTITDKDIQDWIDSLPLGDVTKHNYLRVVKYVLKHALKAKLITTYPGENIQIKFPESQRQFLSKEEIQIVANIEFDRPAVQDAFLFSCFTGLRMADIMSLEWSNIKNGYLHFTQHKTGQSERIKLSDTAKDILSRQERSSRKIFDLPTRKHLFKAINRLMEQANLGKKVTFHCARHTFATQLIENGAELLTVQKLMGHRDIRSTMIYTKLVDKLKDQAIDRLPSLKKKPKK